MRVTGVSLPENPTLGLGKIEMERLGQVVILAGKNGAGKTRILDYLIDSIRATPKPQNVQFAIDNIAQLQQTIKILNLKIDALVANTVMVSDRETLLEQYQSQILGHELSLTQHKAVANYIVRYSESSATYNAVNFVPSSIFLVNPDNTPKSEILNQANKISSPGVNHLAQGTLSKIQVITERFFRASHQLVSSSTDEIDRAKEEYLKLKELIRIFLGTDLYFGVDGPTLFGLELGKLKLSKGQTVLLQLCLAIFAQSESLKDLILILDEPENHLHPFALKEVINRIIEHAPNGQVWISTHSITLLSQFDPSNIYFVEDGQCHYVGKTPERVLKSLLGNDGDIYKLQDFLNLPAQYATNRFAIESLFAPMVSMTAYTDPQVNQINKVLSSKFTGGLNLLDVGAGKGRLILNIYDLGENDPALSVRNLNYVAYDPSVEDKLDCQLSISKVYGSSESRYFNSLEEVAVKYGENFFDVAVMCNVLHEIPPMEWLPLFRENNFLSKTLKDDGYLMIVEDMQIPHGEKAFSEGFLVLDTKNIIDLFNIQNVEELITVSERQGRLKSHLVPFKYLKNVTSESRKNAIRGVRDSCLAKIKEIRDAGRTQYSDGRLHGFYSQQVTNALLLLERL